LTLVLAGILVVGFTLPSIVSLHEVWKSYYYSHGYLVLLLTAFLVFQELRVAPVSPVVPSWAGLASLGLLVAVTLAARALTMESIAQLAWPLTWVAAIWTLAGSAIARRFAMPLAYLCVAIPIWDVLIDPLRSLTIRVVSAWIHAAGLPASIEGNLIHVPSGTFEVAGGCAGLRYALVALALASFAALSYRRTLKSNALLIGTALALALVGNWVRVFVTVVAGHSPESSALVLVRDHHSLFGWVVFVVFLSPWIYLNQALETHDGGAYKVDGKMDRRATTGLRRSGVAYATCALLALAIWFMRPIARAESAVTAQAFEMPDIAGWTRSATWQDARLPLFDAMAEAASWYADGRAHVGAYVASYGNQLQGRELVSLDNRPAGRSGVVIGRRTVSVETASGATLAFLELEVADPGDNRRLVWLSFRVAGNPTASNVVAKLLQAAGAVRHRYDAQAVVLTAVCASDCADARSSLERYAATAAEPLFAVAERSVRITDSLRESDRPVAR
jgi:EpsI family protein